MSVVQSDGLRIGIGVLYLSHAMLVLADLIVCSTGVSMYPSKVVLSYCDESLSGIWKSGGFMYYASRHIFWKTKC